MAQNTAGSKVVGFTNKIVDFPVGSITDASFTVPDNKLFGNTVKCLLFQKSSSSDLSNNVSLGDPVTVGNTKVFKLSKSVSGLTTPQNFFGCPSVSDFSGYIIDSSLTCITATPEPLQICPTFKVTGAGVAANTIITRQADQNTGRAGVYRINNIQTVGSPASPIKFTCIPQNLTFVGALRVDASNNNNKNTTSLYINKGNAYQSEGFPIFGMTLTGNAIKFGGNPVNGVKLYNLASGSATLPYIDISTNASTGVSTYKSNTFSQVLLTTVLDSSGCVFKGLVSGNNKLTATSIIFGSIQVGHSLTGGNDDGSATLTTPAPTISSFIADGSYSFICNCSININTKTLDVHSVPSGYQIPNFSSTSPVKFYIFLLPQNNAPFTLDTYILAYGTGGATINGRGTTGKYTLNKNYTGSNINKQNITLTVQTTLANSGGSIGQYILSSSQPNIKISATDFLLTGPIITGTFI